MPSALMWLLSEFESDTQCVALFPPEGFEGGFCYIERPDLGRVELVCHLLLETDGVLGFTLESEGQFGCILCCHSRMQFAYTIAKVLD